MLNTSIVLRPVLGTMGTNRKKDINYVSVFTGLKISFRDKTLIFTWRKIRQKAGLGTVACGTEAISRSENREAAWLSGGVSV